MVFIVHDSYFPYDADNMPDSITVGELIGALEQYDTKAMVYTYDVEKRRYGELMAWSVVDDVNV